MTNAYTNLFSRTPSFTLSHERHMGRHDAAFSSRGLAATGSLSVRP